MVFFQFSFCIKSRTVISVCAWKFGLSVEMLRLRKSTSKSKKIVKMDFQVDLFSESGQFFWPVCRIIKRSLCKKKITKIYSRTFSRIFQSQNLEGCRNSVFSLSKNITLLMFYGSKERPGRVLPDTFKKITNCVG